jgi:hypothetical protein
MLKARQLEQLVRFGQPQAEKNVNMEAENFFESVPRQRLVKTLQTQKT